MQGSTHRSRVMEMIVWSGSVAEPDGMAVADDEPFRSVAGVRSDHREPAARIREQERPGADVERRVAVRQVDDRASGRDPIDDRVTDPDPLVAIPQVRQEDGRRGHGRFTGATLRATIDKMHPRLGHRHSGRDAARTRFASIASAMPRRTSGGTSESTVTHISASIPWPSGLRPTSIVAMLIEWSPRMVPTLPMMPGRST